MNKLAIIDLGSNSVRMSTYEIESPSVFRETGSYRKMIKLSEGMSGDMMLRKEPILRAAKALIQFREIILRENIENTVAVATAAVRKAENSEDFLREMRETAGVDIRVIDGEKEAYYDFLAVNYGLGVKKGVICDIGGGSIELIGIDEKMTDAVSIPVGSRGITERFFEDGENNEVYENAKRFVNEKLEEQRWLERYKGVPIIGIGGCLRALAKYHTGDNTNKKIEKHIISAADFDKLYLEIGDADITKRSQMAGIGEERADIIMGGAIPLVCIKEKLNAPNIITADIGVREGILCEFLKTVK